MDATIRIRRALSRSAIALLIAGCWSGEPAAPDGELPAGTWGGDNAGVIVSDSVAHVHVGCTYGNFRLPLSFGADGRFEATGEYVLRAYPVAVGPPLPARLTGTVRRAELTFTVTVNDTVARQTVVLGPATATLGREPRMGPCPICAVVPPMEGMAATRPIGTIYGRS
jgi:hypothetical protein